MPARNGLLPPTPANPDPKVPAWTTLPMLARQEAIALLARLMREHLMRRTLAAAGAKGDADD